MAPYSAEDLDRRLQLSRELLSPYARPTLTRDFVAERLSGPGRQLDIPFPSGLAPKPSSDPLSSPDAPLPKADVVVITYTVDEAKALADVMTPGRFAPDWNHYTHKFADYSAEIRPGAPAKMAGRLGSYWTSTINKKRVLVFKSELHMHQDVFALHGKPTLPIKKLFAQIVAECAPQYVFTIGTAGGVYAKYPLGTVALSRSTKFDCKKDFKNESFADEQFRSDWTVPSKHHAAALELMKPFVEHLTIAAGDRLSKCPCTPLQSTAAPAATFLVDGAGEIPAFHPVLTTDYFEFGTDKNNLDSLGVAVEMDDAVFGLACTVMSRAPRWASVRNYSDPEINGSLAMPDQEACASRIYLRYGYWTSVLGAIATWSVVAAL